MFQPVGVDEELLAELHDQAVDWALGRGLIVSKKPEPGQESGGITHAPFTVLPSPLPRELYQQATKLGPDFNMLVHVISKKYDFIVSTLENVPDDFTQRLLKILKTINDEGIKQPITLGIFRSDYMIHNPKPDEYALQQVELNTISAAFPSLSTTISQLHKFIVARYNLIADFPSYDLPENNSLFAVARALAHTHGAINRLEAHIVMIVQPGERNKWDQRHMEYRLWEWHGVRLVRATLAEINEKATLDEQKRLIFEDREVSIVYFRAGYTPNDYPTENEWAARLKMERSTAVKCPNISYHLAGTKKMQQVVANPGVLESLIEDKESVARMRASFTGLYSLSGPESGDIVQKAIENYKDYVLKPQREGGGNNIYNEDLKKALETMTLEERAAYILMDRIRPPAVNTHVIRDGKLGTMNAVYELGIYSAILSVEKPGEAPVIENHSAGLLLRTKGALVEDGGVAAGVAVLDSPLLV